MKKYILASVLSALLFSATSFAQQEVADQNPDFAVSRAKYMRMADSINQWHGTTVQQTYKAFDWYEARMERRDARQQFRRDLRMERARRPYRYQRYNYYDQPYYAPYYSPYRTPGRYHHWWF